MIFGMPWLYEYNFQINWNRPPGVCASGLCCSLVAGWERGARGTWAASCPTKWAFVRLTPIFCCFLAPPENLAPSRVELWLWSCPANSARAIIEERLQGCTWCRYVRTPYIHTCRQYSMHDLTTSTLRVGGSDDGAGQRQMPPHRKGYLI